MAQSILSEIKKYGRIYDKLNKLVDLNELIYGESVYLRYEAKGFMDLHVDLTLTGGTDTDGFFHIALANNYIQNGDVMADPDIGIRFDPNREVAEGLHFQQDGGIGGYYAVYDFKYLSDFTPKAVSVNPYHKKTLNTFLDQWLTDLLRRGYKLVEKQ